MGAGHQRAVDLVRIVLAHGERFIVTKELALHGLAQFHETIGVEYGEQIEIEIGTLRGRQVEDGASQHIGDAAPNSVRDTFSTMAAAMPRYSRQIVAGLRNGHPLGMSALGGAGAGPQLAQRLANDAVFKKAGITKQKIQSILKDKKHFLGNAENQIDAVAAKAKALLKRYPGKAKYEPRGIL